MMKRELQSLTETLQHVTKVVVPGQAFMRSLHALQSVGSSPAHKVWLNLAARADIIWWHLFICKRNGTSMLWNLGRLVPEVTIYIEMPRGGGGAGPTVFPIGSCCHGQQSWNQLPFK